MEIKTFAQFEAFLRSRIPTREALFVGDLGLRRSEYFMHLLGNPQNKIKVIHVAGTSGKGSTAHLISRMLESQGFRVGLSISPHVFDIRERMQINSALPSEKLVLKYFNQILPVIKEMEECEYGAPTFFEINVALAYHMFAEEGLDYAVMETGLGGSLDATNTVTSKNKVCIITRLGLDHTEILGKTISKIAEQKAGIIRNENVVISHRPSVTALKAIRERCENKNADLFIIGKKNYSVISSAPEETVFNWKFTATEFDSESESNSVRRIEFESMKLRLVGIHQAENCSLALVCLALLSRRDNFTISEEKLRVALGNISIPGRCEIKKFQDKTLIIDGAHNPQKMEAFTGNLSNIYPGQKFTFLVAFKKGKDFKGMLEKIIPLADKILLTRFSTSNMDNRWSSVDNDAVSEFLESRNFKNYEVIGNKESDIIQAIKKSPDPVVITGSLYLIGKIYPYIES